jgi:hypothetical protein
MGLRDAVKINVEPGLFEWLFWHQDNLPDCFTPQELCELGYNVNVGYKPFVDEKELKDNAETCTQFYMRNFYVAQSAANVTASQGKKLALWVQFRFLKA